MRVVCIGAHPDDAECFAGGTMIKWAREGADVLVLSLTNGDVGHHEISGRPLARRRAEEAERAAAIGGYRARVFDHHDGELLPTLELRREVVHVIREHGADVVLTHRPWDYHPDHRYTAAVVQDAAFMVTVPHFCPEVPALRVNPVFLYMMDRFTRPAPFRPDVAVDVSDAMPQKWSLLDAMDSQFYEWLPWLDDRLASVPAEGTARREWLVAAWGPFFEEFVLRHRDVLASWYGDGAEGIVSAEFFEVCEYGRRVTREDLSALFPVSSSA